MSFADEGSFRAVSQEKEDQMRPVKLLILTQRFPPSVGGVESIAAMQAHGFAKRGADVTVCVFNPDPVGNESGDFRLVKQPGRSELFHLIREADIVVSHLYTITHLLTARAIGTPWVNVLHGWLRDPHHSSPQSWLSAAKQRLDSGIRLAALRHAATKLVAVSADVARETGGVAEIISNGYRSDIFRVTADPANRNPESVVLMGRLAHEKGIHVALQAIATLVKDGLDPRVTIIGDGPAESQLRNLASDLQLQGHVLFTGRLSQQQANSVLNENAILVMPSLVSESFGLTAIEGSAAGCAVVASGIGALPEVLGESGVLVPPGNVERLAVALRTLMTSSDLLQQARVGVPDNLAKYSPEAMLDKYWNLLMNALSMQRGPWCSAPQRCEAGRHHDDWT